MSEERVLPVPFDPLEPKDDWFIFDLDNTIADGDHRVHLIEGMPPNERKWDEFHAQAHLDKPFPDVLALCQLLGEIYNIAILTGRPEEKRFETISWLHTYGVPFRELHMRPSKDYRPDTEFKGEFYTKHFASRCRRVVGIFEDRDKLVEMWREKFNLTCYQPRRRSS